VRLAIEARDQCVAFRCVCSSVAVTTSSTLSSKIDDGRPGRGSSASPSRRSAMNLPRYRLTVPALTRKLAAASLLDKPSAHASTIFDRSASTCEVLARRDQRTSWSPLRIRQHQPRLGPVRPLAITRPSTRAAANRLRQLPTVTVVTPRSAAIRSYTAPGSAHRSTICARIASLRDAAPRDQRTSWSRSSSVSTNSADPVPGMNTVYQFRARISGGPH
jgi:hypothetical protein